MSEQSATWSSTRVLVTGAGGFIGSHLVEHLVDAGASVRAFVRYNSRNDYGWLETIDSEVLSRIELFRGDLVNPEAVGKAVSGCDVVFHLGALIPIPYSYVHPREYVEANVVATLNVLEACRSHGTRRIVQTSTSEVYGTAQKVPIDEDHPLGAQSPYAATKIGADQLALSFQHSFGTPVVLARPFNTYGPRQSARAVISTVIAQALSGGPVRLGSLHPTRDFTYVTDTAAGLAACGSTEGIEGETINLGSGEEISIGDLADRICKLLGVDSPLEADSTRVRPEASDVERLLADATKAGRLLGWEPTVSLSEGLERTIAWMRLNLDRFKPSLYNI